VLAFEPRRSDLPLQVAFPILVANLTGELLGGTTAPLEAVEPGTPVELTIPAGADRLSVTGPDGTTVELLPSAGGGSRVTFVGTETPGIYTVTPIASAATTSSGSVGSGTTPTGEPTPIGASPNTGGASPGASPLPDDPLTPVSFAVDLFDVDESSIAPGSAASIEALGTSAPAPGAGEGETERPTTRDELWIPIVLVVLLVLAAEWALYHRDALVRIRRSLAARFGRRAATGAG
jgi:hypothetical protein